MQILELQHNGVQLGMFSLLFKGDLKVINSIFNTTISLDTALYGYTRDFGERFHEHIRSVHIVVNDGIFSFYSFKHDSSLVVHRLQIETS